MKKVLLYSAFALGALTMNTGCGEDFLMINPVGSVSESKLTTEEGIDFVLTGAYASFNNMRQVEGCGGASLTNWVFGDIMGADANKGSDPTDQSELTALETFSFNSTNGYVLSRWRAVYEAVMRCNNVMSMASKMGDSLPNAKDIIAQAKFIKAVWMFEGIKTFGAAIPYVTLEDYQANTDPQVSNVDENGDYVYIWDKVEKDLQDAIADLPATRTAGNYGRATSWMAKAVLAKMYLFWSSPYNGTNATDASKLSKASSLLDEIIASGVDAKGQKYQLAEDYYTLWTAGESDWTGESVFDIQTIIHGTQTDTSALIHASMNGLRGILGVGGGWGFYQPTNEFVNSYMVDENGLPLANYTDYEPMTVADEFVTDLTIATDPRVDMVAGRPGVPYFDYGTPAKEKQTLWIRDIGNGGPYVNKKHMIAKADRAAHGTSNAAAASDINYHVIRFADILLMRAECDIRDGGDTKLAHQYINQIRARAAKAGVLADATTKGEHTLENLIDGTITDGMAATYRVGKYPGDDFASVDEAWTALKRELRAEFGMEGHRWFDIARWGEVADVLNAYMAYEVNYLTKFKNVYNEKWVCMPIPDSELKTAEGRFVQTENWIIK